VYSTISDKVFIKNKNKFGKAMTGDAESNKIQVEEVNTYEYRTQQTDLQPKNTNTFYSDTNAMMPHYAGYNISENSQKEIPVIVDMKKVVKGHKKKNYAQKPNFSKKMMNFDF